LDWSWALTPTQSQAALKAKYEEEAVTKLP
jgi:hypothetical protein